MKTQDECGIIIIDHDRGRKSIAAAIPQAGKEFISMKILSIGNSFSTDAQRWLHDIALSDGYALDCVNLYIGGCSLERHYRNMMSGDAVYRYEINGDTGNALPVSLKDALQREAWDVVTLQQNSRFAGIAESLLKERGKIKSIVNRASLYLKAENISVNYTSRNE